MCDALCISRRRVALLIYSVSRDVVPQKEIHSDTERRRPAHLIVCLADLVDSASGAIS